MALPHVNVDQLREERYILGEKILIGLLENCPQNQIIGDNLVRAWAKINSSKYEKIVCSISGGSDSDIMLDIQDWVCLVWHRIRISGDKGAFKVFRREIWNKD